MSPPYLLLLLRAKDKQELFADILTSHIGQAASRRGNPKEPARGPNIPWAISASSAGVYPRSIFAPNAAARCWTC